MRRHRVEALLLKYYYNMRRNLDRVFDVFYWPAVGLFTWGFTTLYLEDVTRSSRFIAFFLGGFILWTLVQRTQQDISVALLEDFWNDNVYNTFSSPLTTPEIFVATSLYGMIRSLAAFAFLFVLALSFYAFNVLSIGVLAVALLAFSLVVFGCALGIFVAGLVYRFGMRIQVFAWSTVFVLQPFSLVFYPRETLPTGFYEISLALPTSYVFEGMRQAISAGVVPWRAVGISIVLGVGYLVVGYATFAFLLEQSRQYGYLAQNT